MIPTNVTRASAEVTTKIEAHEKRSSRAPEMRIPRVPPAPANPAQIPTALGRSSGGNTLVIVDSVPGMISAAPIPMIARTAISWDGVPTETDTSGGKTEHDHAGDQSASPTVPVAEGASGKEQCGQCQPVGVDDPLLIGLAGADARGEMSGARW